jgi:hypothetical protein
MTQDPLDAITWVQYKAAFKIATLALGEIALGDGRADPVKVAADAMEAMRAEVRRFDDSEPSWELPSQDRSAGMVAGIDLGNQDPQVTFSQVGRQGLEP